MKAKFKECNECLCRGRKEICDECESGEFFDESADDINAIEEAEDRRRATELEAINILEGNGGMGYEY